MKFAEDLLFIAPTPLQLAEELSGWFFAQYLESQLFEKPFYVAISGGSTPLLFFNILAAKYGQYIDWKNLHFFWADERCVPPKNSESNFRSAHINLFSKILIPENNIHRIKGEADPIREAKSYSTILFKTLPISNELPCFDLILLGMGDDGHTASIFPGENIKTHFENICEVTTHPNTGQKRITLTTNCINNASKVAFQITGMTKSSVLNEILLSNPTSDKYPAARIKPTKGNLYWFLDAGAANGLCSK